MKKRFSIAVLLMLLLFTGLHVCAQRISDPVLKNAVKTAIAYSEKKPVEKLYIQTDKSVYLAGDTLRLKAYLLHGDYRSPSALSGILYVELDSETGKTFKRLMLPLQAGLAWADMALDTAEVKMGNYTLRAYTNWMRNFGEDYIFKKRITISGYIGNPILVNSLFKQDGEMVEAGLQLKQLDGRALGFKNVELKLMNGNKNLSKDKLVTGGDGKLNFNFNLPQNNEPLSVKLLAAGSPELTIPIELNRPENIDVQFMPEGGQLVAGLQSRVGLKAIGEDGKGMNVTGKIFNSKGEEVSTITTAYKGMGNFEFTPAIAETYTAKFNGITKSYALATPKSSGTVLSVTTSHPDSLTLHVQATPNNNTTYYLIGQARGVVCYAEPVSGTVTKMIARNLFPTGIARFTLLSTNQQPVNERIVFINHKDELRFNIRPHKSSYNTRDSIALAISVTDKDGKPVQGSFSMAVTDNGQVKIDSLGSNILTNLLLTSDLKGEIEEPNYYFTGDKASELDNLMLTQGWVGYDWKEILLPEAKPITYQPEKEFVVSGTVTNAFGKPLEKSPMSLISKNPLIAADTLTDKSGRFVFRDIWPVDTAIFKLQARNKKSKEFNVTIKMDEQSFPEFRGDLSVIKPWYVNSDTTLLNNAGSQVAEERAWQNYKGTGNVLNEVNIKAKKVVKGSKNLNGPGEADLVLDEQDMLKAGKKTLTELLQEKIPGIIEVGYWRPGIAEDAVLMSYLLKGKRVSFIFDGIDIDKFFHPDLASIDVLNPRLSMKERKKMQDDLILRERTAMIKGYLDYYTAEDILGIELMFQSKYNGSYASNLIPDLKGGFTTPNFDTYAYIEITTRSKQGPFMKATPGTYLYKPLAFTLPKQFYSPKYTVNNKSIALGTDMRSTIFWEPDIITDAAGKATVSFYSADKVVNYSVIIEGTDMEGHLGSQRSAVTINPVSP